MPGFDGTGPIGRGPMTGGTRGYCGASKRFSDRSFNRRNPGSEFQNGRRRRNGYRNMMQAPRTSGRMEFGATGNLNFLKNRVTILREALNDISRRVRDLEPETKNKDVTEKE